MSRESNITKIAVREVTPEDRIQEELYAITVISLVGTYNEIVENCIIEIRELSLLI